MAAGALFVAHTSQAADHLDSPSVLSNPMADITDVYAWMDPSGSLVNLIMDVSPGDTPTSTGFGPSVLYVFHVNAQTAFGGTSLPEVKVICKFATNTSAQCWVGSQDYVTGDPTNTNGIQSASTKVRLFAGRRSDPFFFNLVAFKDTVKFVEGQAALTFNAAGCPQLPDAGGSAVRACLGGSPTNSTACTGINWDATGTPCATDSPDCFAHLDVRSIVLQVDKGLLGVDSTHPVIAVWGSTHMSN